MIIRVTFLSYVFVLSLAISLVFGGGTYAQNNRFQFSHLDINNGISHNQVNSILKDKKGFLWFGTASGLNRYDGYKFKVFKHIVNDSSSLDDDFIMSVSEGPSEKLWIQTRNGFNIYDPSTERFDHNISGYLKSIGINNPYIATIKKDRDGKFWILHVNWGVYLYDPATRLTRHFTHGFSDRTRIFCDTVSDVAQDLHGNIWLVYKRGVMERLDPRHDYRITYRAQLFDRVSVPNNSYKLFIDNQDDIWAYVPTYSSGVYYFNPRTQTCRHISKGAGNTHLNTDVIAGITQDNQQRIWMATDHGGIDLLDKSTFTFTYLLNREDDNKTLAQNSTTIIYRDNTNTVWIGTYKKGVSYFHPDIIKFPLFTHHLTDPSGISFSDINCFEEDRFHNLWIGTNGGGLIYYDRRKGTFKTYRHDPRNANSLTTNVIVCMYMDHEQRLWLGTYFGGLDCYDGKTFKHYRHSETDPYSISEDRICAIYEDSSHHLWVGTLAGGLNEIDPETGRVLYKLGNKPDELHSNYVSALAEDPEKNLWVVTSYGVDVWQRRSKRLIHYIHNEKDPHSLISNNTNNIFMDSRGLIWISTREGISIFDPVKHQFTNLSKQDGLPDNTVIDLQEDDRHNMWASTANGLSNIRISASGRHSLKFSFVNYNESDGLQGSEFNENSSLRLSSGELIFGGGNGFNIFRPADVNVSSPVPQIVFTDFQVFNQNLNVGQKVFGNVILHRAVTEQGFIELNHNVNVFSLSFAALNYINPEKVKYRYMLAGFDKDWTNADNKVRMATYTNLDPGDYTFKVQAAVNDVWNGPVKTLRLSILPPFWKTPLAYILYGLAAICLVFYIRKRGIDKLRLQFSIEKEREEARRMHELDLMKIKFFTNVSHEFRTPLSLIIAPVDKMLKQSPERSVKHQLELINRNARRLLNMVNQLLDFRKMEHQELKLHTRPGEIIGFIKDLCYSFTDIAEQKHINFIFDSDTEAFHTAFDPVKLERILFNLLSNAYKFTPEGGNVSVLLSLTGYEEQFMLEIKVMDTGIGIPAGMQQRIFESFYQGDIPGSMLNQGSGIGLSITKEFVRLHHGEISLESEPEQGSCFTIKMPLKQVRDVPLTDKPVGMADSEPFTGNYLETNKYDRKDLKKPTVLLVEDNDDFRFYLRANLKDHFNILEAENGRKGWQKALAQHPNLVVSDISMPEMTGSELCIKIKNDPRTMHIPVILLTALTGEDEQLKGLETGAADYMTKPFNFDILLHKIRNLLYQQETMRKTYQKQVEAVPAEVEVESPDNLFLNKVLLLIDNNIANPNFSVEELSGDMFVSRYTLYKKVLALTGKTPNELVRSMRLKRAAQLLNSGHLTISQVCHKVGFKSQKYFVKQFKAEFNTIPSRYTEDAQSE